MRIFLPVLVLFLLAATGVNAQTSCLNYWSVGMSGCEGQAEEVPEKTEEPPQPEVVTVKPDAPQEKMKKPRVTQIPMGDEEEVVVEEKTLDERIDEFMENYGKPPREFVAFNLEPTLENAIAWVTAYRETLDRNTKIAAAWTQANTLYEEALKKGVLLPGMDKEKEEVPDYTQNMPPELRVLLQQKQTLNDLPPDLVAALGGDSAARELIGKVMGQDVKKQPTGSITLGASSEAGQEEFSGISTARASMANDGHITERADIGTPGAGRISVNYYFSAECPYCKKFEPQFQRVIEEMGDQLEVTCVDMTPSNKTQENIFGKVDCAWRPLMAGEMDEYGVKTTPTLIINRGEGKPLERVAGYVDGSTLKRHLLSGKN